MLVNNLSQRFRPSTANQTRNLLREFCETGSCRGFRNRHRLLHRRMEGCRKVCRGKRFRQYFVYGIFMSNLILRPPLSLINIPYMVKASCSG